jgi:hypothetical protein
MASDGMTFVECNNCWLGHAQRTHELVAPREWAVENGWSTDVDGRDYCPRCDAAGLAGVAVARGPGPRTPNTMAATLHVT